MVNYILPHLGLGDYLVCNGLIRNLVKPDEQYILFTNFKYKESVEFMFRDLPNLTYSLVPPVEFNRQYIMPYIKHPEYKLITIGYDAMDYSTSADKMFYKQHKVDFEKRWSDFFVERDLEKEQDIFKHYNVKENEYIFLHEGGSANDAVIDKNKINNDLQIVSPELTLTKNVFDYCYLIEHAAEIHVVESSFLFLIDSIKTNGKLFAHRYARKLAKYTIPNLKKNWEIIE
jgi:hypothetical protein